MKDIIDSKYPINERPWAIRIYYDMAKLKDYVYCRVYVGALGNAEFCGNLVIPIGQWNEFRNKGACYYINDSEALGSTPVTFDLRD